MKRPQGLVCGLLALLSLPATAQQPAEAPPAEPAAEPIAEVEVVEVPQIVARAEAALFEIDEIRSRPDFEANLAATRLEVEVLAESIAADLVTDGDYERLSRQQLEEDLDPVGGIRGGSRVEVPEPGLEVAALADLEHDVLR